MRSLAARLFSAFRSRFRLCLALQKPLLRCVVFWSVSFLFIAGFENQLGALVLCFGFVILVHRYETPESQQSSNFLSKSPIGLSGRARQCDILRRG